MRITRLTLPSTDVGACLAFYRDVLQLLTTGSTVHVGWTDIEIVPTSCCVVRAGRSGFNSGARGIRIPFTSPVPMTRCSNLSGDVRSASVAPSRQGSVAAKSPA